MSLIPIWNALENSDKVSTIHAIGFASEYCSGALESIISAKFPVIIGSSPLAVDRAMRSLRPRWSYWLVGVEHGVSPFKNFTYSTSFLVYDDYFAPSRLWLERLCRLYPDARTRFHLGDYPKASQFVRSRPPTAGDDIEDEGFLPPSLIKMLVIISWGINEHAFNGLPDREDVTYLLHPAQAKFKNPASFSKSKVIWSSGDIAKQLVEESTIIFGDLSSLTFEVALSRPTYLFLSNSLYIDNYDLDERILDIHSPMYGCVPETSYRIDRRFILDLDELKRALRGEFPTGKMPLHLEPIFMPQIIDDETEACSDGILSIVELRDEMMKRRGAETYDAQLAKFLRSAYVTILGREPDISGIERYMPAAKSRDTSPLVIGLEILLDIAKSEEARNSFQSIGDIWPLLHLGQAEVNEGSDHMPTSIEKSLAKPGCATRKVRSPRWMIDMFRNSYHTLLRRPTR